MITTKEILPIKVLSIKPNEDETLFTVIFQVDDKNHKDYKKKYQEILNEKELGERIFIEKKDVEKMKIEFDRMKANGEC